ncbi:MAG TPA: hypothetical protein VEI52_07885 [Terriglobales bacterium]|nr:hypothetical protein [Terriglobales bacterium]
MRNFVCWLVIAVIILPAVAAAASPELEARRKALNDLLQEQWE